MAKVVKVIELMSQWPESWEDAAQGAVKEASKTLRNIRSIYTNEFTAQVDAAKLQTIGSTQRSLLIWSAGNETTQSARPSERTQMLLRLPKSDRRGSDLGLKANAPCWAV